MKRFGRADGASHLPGCAITGREAFDAIRDMSPVDHGYFSAVVLTRWGARFKEWGDADDVRLGENHRDVALASFAEDGVPTTTVLACDNGTHVSVADLLCDQVANLTLDQRELAWTVIALALYMPGQTEWRNRDGEVITRDRLAQELLQRKLTLESCGGTHILQAIGTLYCVDLAQPTLSSQTREALTKYLLKSVGAAATNQADDGRWGRNWHNGVAEEEQTSTVLRESDLLITGHLLEWLIYLPDELQPARQVYDRATAWVADALLKDSELRPSICPYVHATRSLAILCRGVAKP